MSCESPSKHEFLCKLVKAIRMELLDRVGGSRSPYDGWMTSEWQERLKGIVVGSISIQQILSPSRKLLLINMERKGVCYSR